MSLWNQRVGVLGASSRSIHRLDHTKTLRRPNHALFLYYIKLLATVAMVIVHRRDEPARLAARAGHDEVQFDKFRRPADRKC